MTGSDAIVLWLSVFLLWALWFFCWEPLRIDLMRERLFQIRHELFLFACDNDIPFDHPAYAGLRTRINAMIRFAHTLTFFRTLLLSFLEKWSPLVQGMNSFARWTSEVDTLSPELATRLMEFHEKVLMEIAMHQIYGPAFPVFLMLFVPKSVIKHFRDRPSLSPQDQLARQVGILEAQVVEEFECEMHPAMA